MKGKKIGILTQPLCQNYGGLLQAYALQVALKQMGFTPIIIDLHYNYPKWRKVLSDFITISLRFLSLNNTRKTSRERKIRAHYTDYFINKYIVPKSPKLFTNRELKGFIRKHEFYAFIVGSDQVWRPQYSPNLNSYFLDFLERNNKVKKISYAASFGVDYWEFSKAETLMARKLLPLFNSVSVREDSAKDLCLKYLSVNALQVLDPTMLLSQENYISLINEEKEGKSEGELFVYLLDETNEKLTLCNLVEKEISLSSFRIRFTNVLNEKYNVSNFFVYSPVTSWLRAFYDAKFIITDSFHGCVFSIIFNKPFVAIGNPSRGLSRFTSLLRMFNLQDQLILESSTSDNVKQAINNHIDWSLINRKLEKERDISLWFLKKNLKDE